ncbi:MAG: class I SAM-dependent methyltransferase [Candidatus Dojkabacteria bacterium]|nr:class I SAM-dependent methyltransferase [Candidatus Dojkabacteria bacterium]
MAWFNIPPGSILQHFYLKERIKKIPTICRRFLDIGCGNGYVSRIFLEEGWEGVGIDLNEEACKFNYAFNQKYISSKRYTIINDDFLKVNLPYDKYDVIVSYMVIEHLDNEELANFIKKSMNLLYNKGTLIFQVPANMKFWGIEDDIAGHVKRYEMNDIINLSSEHNLKINHIAGLNYPISNWLLSLSNILIKRQEKDKLTLSQKEKTIYSGKRDVLLKTKFPRIFALILNPFFLYPFHLLQKFFSISVNR